MDWLIPEDPDELVDALRDPPHADRPLLATGAAAPAASLRRAPGLPEADVVSTSALDGVHELRPRDLTVTAGAGTRVEDLVARLREEGTWIPLPDVSLGRSVGGLVSGAWPGPFDESHGDVRRQLLACEVVTWDGRAARWGRGVMKNVAGYGLTRAVAGATGRLGVVHRATFRLWPAPAADRTARLLPAGGGDALDLAGRAAKGELDARVRPDAVVWRGGADAAEGGRLEVRLLGSGDSVDLRLERLRAWADELDAEVGPVADAPRADAADRAEGRPPGSGAAWIAPGRARFVPAARDVLSAAGGDLASASGHPLAGRLRVAWGRDGGDGEGDAAPAAGEPGGPAAAVLDAAGDAPVSLERGSAEALALADGRRPPGVRRLEERVVSSLGGRPRHWLSGYL